MHMISSLPPPSVKSFGPSSPIELAKRRDQALMSTDTKVTAGKDVPSAQEWAAEKISRGAKPDALIIGEQDATGEKQNAAPPSRLTEFILSGADPTLLFAALTSKASMGDPAGAHALEQARSEAAQAFRKATQGYASASRAFQETIQRSMKLSLDVRVGERPLALMQASSPV